MNKYHKMFNTLFKNNEKALVPFLTIGDPNPELFIKIIDTVIQNGADALELGIPFSDPIADGPIIQNSMKRTLCTGITLKSCFHLIYKIRKRYTNIPIGILTYANLVFHNNIDKFYSQCSYIGIDSILIADLPLEESHQFQQIAERKNIKMIFICPPNANKIFLQNILLLYKKLPFIYLVSRPGVTGKKNNQYFLNNLNTIVDIIKKQQNNIPILQGFGIFTPPDIHQALSRNINGVIVGSAIIQIIEKNLQHPSKLIEKIKNLIYKMKLATKYSQFLLNSSKQNKK